MFAVKNGDEGREACIIENHRWKKNSGKESGLFSAIVIETKWKLLG